MRRFITAILAVLSSAAILTAGNNNQEEQLEMVRASERTVIIVEGKAEPVKAKAQERPRPGKLTRTTMTGAGRFAGWLLNVSDDIPSARERTNVRARVPSAAAISTYVAVDTPQHR
jgi:hypothetical protein